MPKLTVTTQALINRRALVFAEQESIAARLRAAESELGIAHAELRKLGPSRNTVVHGTPGTGKTHLLAQYVAKERELQDLQQNVRSLTIEYNSLGAKIQEIDDQIRRGVHVEIPFGESAVGVILVEDARLARRHERAKHAERRALAVLDRFSALIPNQAICSEEIGDAGEWMGRRANAGWSPFWMYLKMVTTMFWLVVNAWRDKGKK